MSTSTGAPSSAALGIENTNINTAPGVQLDDKQKVIVGSILDVSLPTQPRGHWGRIWKVKTNGEIVICRKANLTKAATMDRTFPSLLES